MAQHPGHTIGALILALACSQAAADTIPSTPPPTLPSAPVCMEAILQGTEGAMRMVVEIAADPASRQQGLMHREHLPLNRGMLFLFDTPAAYSFWMANTSIPLDIVPLDADGRVVEVLAGVPFSRDQVTPSVPVQRILEVNAGIIATMGAHPDGRFVLLGGVDCDTGSITPVDPLVEDLP